MTYNFWIVLCVFFGNALGYYIFAFKDIKVDTPDYYGKLPDSIDNAENVKVCKNGCNMVKLEEEFDKNVIANN